ncbi:hypothetical protein CANINC_001031 [Pichia inconspicua]|uniref:Zn(2)-C6 fungal-type domain-containing protein n=1 Tax=Pichia inconspicua TaxID=52247 RepID=A0A4T0X4J8_9ASCO|nr:hypothetical protein CANINC_001031 [[Candida] inconspicua]
MEESGLKDKVKKTRNKISVICQHCRKRKQKCDRKKPCGNCVESGLDKSCKYAVIQQNAHPKVNLNNEIIKLKLRINKLERIIHMHNIDLSTYKDIMPELTNDDTDEEDDPTVSLSEKFDSMMIKENKVLHSGTTSFFTYVTQDKKLASVFSEIQFSHQQIYENYKQKLKMKASEFNFKFDANHAKWLSETSCSQREWGSKEIQICATDTPPNVLLVQLLLNTIKEVNTFLPSFAVVNSLIDHFFEYVYPLIPLVDEDIFREDLNCVLIENPDGTINIDIPDEQIPVLREFIQSGAEIGTNYPVHAKHILMSLPGQESIFKKITLRNVQVLLLLRLYQAYSPEMHEENKENSLALSIIIQMCRSFGSTRDLAKFPDIFEDPREINLWRRLFFKLLSLDAQNAFEYGCPLIISDDEYDVTLPRLEESEMETLKSIKKGAAVTKSAEEIKKIVLENSINKDIALEYELILLIREGLNEFQNFKKKTKRSTLVRTLRKIQTFVDTKIPSMWELVQPLKNEGSINHFEKYCGATRTRVFETKLSALNYLMGFYYLLFLNDEVDSSYANTTPDSETFENNEELKKQDRSNIDMARAIEISFIILKFNYDYCKFMNQRGSGAVDAMNYQVYKTFSKKCEIFLFNRLMTAFVRAFLFLSSLFMRNIDERIVKVENLIKDFSNTIDAGVVLKWLEITKLENQDSCPEGTDELGMMIFLFIMNLFFEQYNLKDKFYMSWKIQMIIRIFVNYFSNNDKYSCKELLQPIINTDCRLSSSTSTSTFEEGKPLTSDLHRSGSSEDSSYNGRDPDFVFDNQYNGEVIETHFSDVENDKFMEDFLSSIDGNADLDAINSQARTFDINQLINPDPSRSIFDVLMEETKIHSNVEDVNLFSNNFFNSDNFQDIIDIFGASPTPDTDLFDSEIPHIRTSTSISSGSVLTARFDAFNSVD